jgi:deazaflavin-dependent oxidoreductase (nitroreductase family)
MTDMNDFNQGVIAEFRANGGKVGGPFEGASMVLVTHTGAKSGVQRTTPLVCSRDGDDVVIIASMGGAPTNPAWYHNMVTNTAVHVEIGDESYDATVVEAQGDERDRLFAAQAAVMPQFAEYEVKAGVRVIPVLRLVRN